MQELRVKYKDIYCDGNEYGIFNIVGEDDLIEYLREKYGDKFYFCEYCEMRFKIRENNQERVIKCNERNAVKIKRRVRSRTNSSSGIF